MRKRRKGIQISNVNGQDTRYNQNREQPFLVPEQPGISNTVVRQKEEEKLRRVDPFKDEEDIAAEEAAEKAAEEKLREGESEENHAMEQKIVHYYAKKELVDDIRSVAMKKAGTTPSKADDKIARNIDADDLEGLLGDEGVQVSEAIAEGLEMMGL